MNLRVTQIERAGVTVTWRGTTAFDARIKGVGVEFWERLDDNFVMLDFAVSDGVVGQLRIRPKVNKHYLPSPHSGMVRIRLGKDPTHDLSSMQNEARLALYADVKANGSKALLRAEEHVASFLGSAPVARTPARTSLTSLGSGYVVMSVAQARSWKRSKADLDALLRGGDEAAIVETSVGPVLSLGTPDALHLVPRKDSLLLVRIVSCDSEDGLEERLAAIRGTRFKPLDASLDVDGACVVFDSGLAGAKAIKSDEDHLPLALSRGSFTISFKVDANEGDEFSVVRLTRR